MKPKKPRPINYSRSKARKQQFAEGSLERKLQFQEREQSKFDQETERMIRKFSGNLKKPS
jgi:hypothetical protein